MFGGLVWQEARLLNSREHFVSWQVLLFSALLLLLCQGKMRHVDVFDDKRSLFLLLLQYSHGIRISLSLLRIAVIKGDKFLMRGVFVAAIYIGGENPSSLALALSSPSSPSSWLPRIHVLTYSKDHTHFCVPRLPVHLTEPIVTERTKLRKRNTQLRLGERMNGRPQYEKRHSIFHPRFIRL